MLRLCMAMVVVCCVFVADARADTMDEVAKLRAKVERLVAENDSLKDQLVKLKKELAELRMNAKTPQKDTTPPVNDPFAVEAIFTGKRTIIANRDKVHQDIKLVITSRKGSSFEGELTITHVETNQEFTVKVAGTAPAGNGKALFTTEKFGKFKQRFAGSYANGAFGFECSGTSMSGDAIGGKGSIKSK